MGNKTQYPLTWDLDALYPNPEEAEFLDIFEKLSANLKDLAERSESLPAVNDNADHAKTWADFLQSYSAADECAYDLESHIACHASADSENKVFQQFEARMATLRPLKEQISTNIELALRDANDDELATFIKADERLGEIDFYLQDRRSNAAMRLPKEQELLSAELAVDGIHGWGRLYDHLSSSLRIRVMERGEIVEKSPGQVPFDSSQRAVRENNFHAADKAWSTIADPCADALNHIAGTRLTIYRRLGVTDHLEAPLRCNRLQRKSLEAMWTAVCERKPMLLKYMEAKSRLLGLEKLAWYDTQAPLPSSPAAGGNKSLPYDTACNMVIDSFDRFSPEFGDFARRAIEEGWIEAENRSGKRQGGFCTGFPAKKQSRIFMTYTDSPDSMSTLAHELGHAYHSFVLRDQPVFLQIYPMNLAETASNFAETVLGEQLRSAAKSPEEELSILENMLSDAVVNLMNIHARFLFEDNFHIERNRGEVSSERLSELMLNAQQEAYCNALAEDGWNPNFWISKLHFYISELPFYNFPYLFGYLLSLGIYALADEFGEEFPARYNKFLVATGCRNTEDAIQTTLENDVTDTQFWHKSLNVIEQRVERYLELSG